MRTSILDPRSRWVGCLLVAAAFAPSCASQSPAPQSLELDAVSEALSADELECERDKRECLVAADCAADKREACESTFRACMEPVRAEKDRVHEQCRAERETCEDGAADEAAKHACHIAEHRCTLPVEPPDAICRIDAEECRWAANGMSDPPPPPEPDSAAEKACRDAEHACRESHHMDMEDLPKPPHCKDDPKPPPPPCGPMAPPEPPEADDAPVMPAPLPGEPDCELTKRQCQIAADCDPDKREVCESDFRTCDEPARTEKKRVHDECRAKRETCEAAATDEAGRHECHMAEHECNLPVEPPEAVCRIEAEKCRWAANPHTDPPPPPPEPMMPPPEPSAEEKACRDQEHACVEEKKVHRDDLPKPPRCEPKPPACMPEMP